MATLPFERNELELRILAICMKDLSSLERAIPKEFFSGKGHKEFYDWLKDWVLRFRSLPTKECLATIDKPIVAEVWAGAEPFINQVDARDFEWYLDILHKEYTRGVLLELGNTIALKVADEDPLKLSQDVISATAGMMRSLDKTGPNRGWIWESADERWAKYESREIDPMPKGIPSGLQKLDELMLGGFRKSEVALVFGPTSSGKSRLLLNVGYNQALMYNQSVMYISLEMARDLLESCFDSRNAILDYTPLSMGKLSPVSKSQYKAELDKLVQRKPLFYVVDNPGEMNTVGLVSELNLFRSKVGSYPDSVILDYANLIDPVGSYNGKSEKFDLLFSQFKRVARQYNVSLLTATQESRTASHLESRDEAGLEHIGQSNYMAPHCAVVMYLYQDELMRQKSAFSCGEIAISLLKNRYGALGKFTVFAEWAYNYIGDNRLLGGALEVKSKK